MQELLAYAAETQHDKIVLGSALAVALIMMGCEEGADTVVEQMTRHKHPLIR